LQEADTWISLVRDEMGGSASSTQYHDCLAGCLREIKTIACRERLQQLFVEQFRLWADT
jgi:hypothetical protein